PQCFQQNQRSKSGNPEPEQAGPKAKPPTEMYGGERQREEREIAPSAASGAGGGGEQGRQHIYDAQCKHGQWRPGGQRQQPDKLSDKCRRYELTPPETFRVGFDGLHLPKPVTKVLPGQRKQRGSNRVFAFDRRRQQDLSPSQAEPVIHFKV